MSKLGPRYAAIPLLLCFTVSLVYELWRATAHAGESAWDHVALWYVPFYGLGFALAWLAWRGAKKGWAFVLASCTIMWAVGAIFYNPIVLMERHPEFVDHLESAVYMGLLAFTAGVAVERLRSATKPA